MTSARVHRETGLAWGQLPEQGSPRPQGAGAGEAGGITFMDTRMWLYLC